MAPSISARPPMVPPRTVPRGGFFPRSGIEGVTELETEGDLSRVVEKLPEFVERFTGVVESNPGIGEDILEVVENIPGIGEGMPEIAEELPEPGGEFSVGVGVFLVAGIGVVAGGSSPSSNLLERN